MQPRINITSVSPGALKAMLGLGNYLRQCSLDAKLLDLINLRFHRSTAARTALTWIGRTCAPPAKPSSAFNCMPPESISQ